MAFQCYECHHKQGRCKYHETSGLYAIGDHVAWPGIKVWLPSIGTVSVGPCEDCKAERPCVNC
jgi:hypothetical protein